MSSQNKKNVARPIGVFDSGLGGLTVVKELRRKLPNEKIIYFGDIARLPYGIKSKKQIIECSKENTQFLKSKNVKALVVACNSSASVSIPTLKKIFKLPIIDVIQPAVEAAVRTTQAGRIAVLGTQATIDSGAYQKAIKKKDEKIKVFSIACPLFVPLVEEGWANNDIAKKTIETYLSSLKSKKIDVLILGCTHYPLLKTSIQKFMGDKVVLIDSAGPTVKTLAEKVLLNQKSIGSNKALEICVTDFPRNFVKIGERFLGHKMEKVQVIQLSKGLLRGKESMVLSSE